MRTTSGRATSIMVRCDVVMANDVSGPVAFRVIEQMGASRVFDPAKVVMVADHFMPAKDARSAGVQRRLKEWSEAQGVTFFGQGRGGIEHTLLCEEGWVVPGSVIAGGDSHTCTYGALGAFGSGFGSTDIAACLAFGEFWQAVPATIQVELTGLGRSWPARTSSSRSSARSASAAPRTAALEFVGDGAEALSHGRASRCLEHGRRGRRRHGPLSGRRDDRCLPRRPHGAAMAAERTDPDAEFARRVAVDLSALEALVAKPHLPGNVVPVWEVEGTKVDQAYIGNCANGTMTDLRQTAEVLRGNRVHPDCRLIVVPATQRIYREALAEGLLDIFVEAGAWCPHRRAGRASAGAWACSPPASGP